MNPRIISALVLRYLFLYSRTPMRLVELIFWPLVELLIWGNLTHYIQGQSTSQFSHEIVFLVGAFILWDVIFRAQQGVAISFLEDVWTRNLLNVFVAPVRTSEYVAATFLVGFIRICITMLALCTVAFLLYHFSVFQMSWGLIPFFGNLLVTGWALGMISTALILRWGQAAESLAWAVPFFIQPITAVFYPVAKMEPQWTQNLAWCLPSTYVFEGMRELLNTNVFNWRYFGWSVGLNVIFIAVAGWIFTWMLSMTKRRGLLTKFATQ
jgi:ABC-2 type transport system permease protein